MSAKESHELRDPRFGPEALTKRYFGGSSLAIQQEIGRGRYVVATRRIPAGSVVMDALPYAFAVEDELKSIACAHCLKPSIETMAAIASSSIASVDAVLFNERLEAGEDFRVIQQELMDCLQQRSEVQSTVEEDVPLDIAMATLENNVTDSELQASPSTENVSDPSSTATWSIHCDQCQQVYYCSEACAEQNTEIHKYQCGPLAKLRRQSWIPADLTMARTIIHTLAKRHMESIHTAESANTSNALVPCGGWANASDFAREQYAAFTFDFDVMSLVSNERDIAAKTLARRRPLVQFLKRIGEKFPALAVGDTTMIVQLIGKIDQNTFGVRFDRNLSYAFGLFPNMSYFNHTCAPNVCVIQHNTVLNIMAMRDIEAGEEVGISYIETNRNTKDRRKCLQVEYNFYCRCSRCNAPPTNTAEDDFVQRYVCKNRSCDGKGLLIPLPGSSGPEDTACNICQSTLIIKRS
jgi:SET and MYND domain-containing protein